MIVGENVPIGFLADGDIVTESDLTTPSTGPSAAIPGLVTQQELYAPSAAPSAAIPGLVTQQELYAPSAPSASIPGLVTQQELYAPSASTWAPPPGAVMTRAQLMTPQAAPPPAAPARTMPAQGARMAPPVQAPQRSRIGPPPASLRPQPGQKPQGAFAAGSGGGMFANLPPWAPYAMAAGGLVLVTLILVAVIPKKAPPAA
jgi:hypothetical protein